MLIFLLNSDRSNDSVRLYKRLFQVNPATLPLLERNKRSKKYETPV
jgi:hypothetical protein